MDVPSYTDEQLSHIWENCLIQLKKEIPVVEYDSFISTLVLKDIQEDVAYFTVPNDFYINIIYTVIYEKIVLHSFIVNQHICICR